MELSEYFAFYRCNCLSRNFSEEVAWMREIIIGFLEGFKEFGQNITTLINSILLTPVYIIGVGLTSILAKLSGKKFLENDVKKRATYWSELNLEKKNLEDHYRQF